MAKAPVRPEYLESLLPKRLNASVYAAAMQGRHGSPRPFIDHTDRTATAMAGISSLVGLIRESDARAIDYDRDSGEIPPLSPFDKDHLLELVQYVADTVVSDVQELSLWADKDFVKGATNHG